MNSQQLQCFIYVAERLNFTKAAEALYLSVPTVTHHIKSLEEELGIQLFYRSSRVVKLTENGEKFYFDAKDFYPDAGIEGTFSGSFGTGNRDVSNWMYDGKRI